MMRMPGGAGWLAALALVLVCAAWPAAALARIYTCEAEPGRVILRDVPCKRGEITRQEEMKQAPPPAARAPEPKPQPKYQQKLSEPMVRELAQTVVGAFSKGDLKALLPLLSADAVFEMEFRLLTGVQVVRYTKEEYTARLRDGLKPGNDYSYRLERSDVVLAPGEEYAEIVTSELQSVWFQSQWQPGATRSRWSVEMREGRPQITLLRAVVTLPSQH
jgi:hypothetical protein